MINFTFTTEVKEEEGVLVLTDANFDEVIKNHQYLLVEFYAPWCGHCKKLAPEYAKAAQALKADNLFLAKVDATEQKELGKRFEVQGYPTLKFFINGTPVEYEGGRTEIEIVNWVRKKSGPASREAKTSAEVEDHKNKNEVLAVFFGDASHPSHSTFEAVAKGFDDVSFVYCGAEECASHFNAPRSSVVLFKKFDEGRNDLPEGFSSDKLKSFIDAHSSPTVMKFDEKSAQHIFGKSQPALFLYRDKNSEQTAHLDTLFTSAAKKLKGRIQSVITDIKEGLESRLAEYIGVTSKDLPTVRIADTRSDLSKFNMEGDITEENVLKFVEQWESGKLRPHLKSDPIPEKQEGDVVVVVGKSFADIVLDDTKDVLVEFYAPWCGHCKKLTPIYDELATKLKHNKNLVIAKVDATTNEVEGVHIKGFPTLKFWPAGKKTNPIDYDGERTLDGFMEWLPKHVTMPIETAKTDL
jgi:protein disulfide-isomerase A1